MSVEIAKRLKAWVRQYDVSYEMYGKRIYRPYEYKFGEWLELADAGDLKSSVRRT